MVKFRTLDGEASIKGFGLLLIEPTFDYGPNFDIVVYTIIYVFF